MNDDRRPELISGTLCAVLTFASFWCARSLALWVESAILIASCGTAPADFVLTFSHEPFSFESLIWLVGASFTVVGALLRRRQRAGNAALALLFLAPILPVVTLAASTSALLTPFLSLAHPLK